MTRESEIMDPIGKALSDPVLASRTRDARPEFGSEEDRIREAYRRRRTEVTTNRYSLFLPGNLARIHEIEHHILRLLRTHGGEDLRSCKVLEVGCGNGYWLRKFVEWGASPAALHGIDLLEDRIAEARSLTHPDVKFCAGSAAHLDFGDAAFDLVCQFMMFSSIIDWRFRQQVAHEMIRVLKPGGMILWYDFGVDNPRNNAVRGVKRADIHKLFPGFRIKLTRITVLPVVSRRLGRASRLIYPLMSAIKLLNSHYVGILTK